LSHESADHTVIVQAGSGELLDGRWKLEERIGKGAMGNVFKGRDVAQQRAVAVKILAPDHCRKPKALARFEREAALLTNLSHENIVKVYGNGRRGALPYIVMELLRGKTLFELAQLNGSRLSLAQTMALLKQVKEGLSFLHRNRLVHRDIKPQNIFLTEAGRVTILDLGIVRDHRQTSALTRPGAMVGTPYYMAPEQILGVEDIDARADLYSTAAMTFELLTGRPPFAGSNNFEVLYGHKNAPPPSATALVKSVPEAVSEVLAVTLSKRREARPKTIEVFWQALERAAALSPGLLAKAAAELYREPPTVFLDRKQLLAQFEKEGLGSKAVAKGAAASNPFDPESDRTTLVGRPPEREPSFSKRRTELNVMGKVMIAAAFRGRKVKAMVEVDGVERGLAPLTLQLPSGTHTLKMTMSGFRMVERSFEVPPGKLVPMSVTLEVV
jgi:serine/threonine protein kinase